MFVEGIRFIDRSLNSKVLMACPPNAGKGGDENPRILSYYKPV